jgi:hypothetical protein
MEVAMQQQWSDILLDAMWDVRQRLLLVTPRLLAALTVILVAWIAAALVRRITARVLRAADLDVRCARWGLTGILHRGGHRPSLTDVIGRVVYWAILLIGLLMVVDILDMRGTAGAVGVLLSFLPHVIVAVVVMVGGWILAQFVAQAVLIAAVNAQVAGATLLATVVRGLLLTVASAP